MLTFREIINAVIKPSKVGMLTMSLAFLGIQNNAVSIWKLALHHKENAVALRIFYTHDVSVQTAIFTNWQVIFL